jgi:hypothetical protein
VEATISLLTAFVSSLETKDRFHQSL